MIFFFWIQQTLRSRRKLLGDSIDKQGVEEFQSQSGVAIAHFRVATVLRQKLGWKVSVMDDNRFVEMLNELEMIGRVLS